MTAQKKTSLSQAIKKENLENFIKEDENDPAGDLEKLDPALKRPVQGNGTEAPKASSRAKGDG